MLQLPNGCYCSTPIISPADWDTDDCSVMKTWSIQYRFYDPLFLNDHPNGKFVLLKQGMNKVKDIKIKRKVAKTILEATLDRLLKEGYNPITGVAKADKSQLGKIQEYEIPPDTLITEALQAAYSRLKGYEPQTLSDIKSVLKYVKLSTFQLQLGSMQIKDVERKHMRAIIENCNKSKDRKNKYKSWLSVLFEELIDAETIEHNPVEKIRKDRVTRGVRPTISIKERVYLDEHLKKDNYKLWRLMHIYFHSGARETELTSVKVSDVNLANQEYKVLIKKGGQYVYKTKVIKDIALYYWADLLKTAGKNDYIFSTYLDPGPDKINADRINKLWKKYVKDAYGIYGDFATLKHSHSTEVVAFINNKAAAEHNSHTTTRMVDEVYDVERFTRPDRTVKSLKNEFAPAGKALP